MTFGRRLIHAEIIGVVSLLIVAFLILVLTASYGLIFHSATFVSLTDPQQILSGIQTIGYIITWGAIPVVFYGAPVFSVYLPEPANAKWKILLLSVLPGVLISFGVWGLGVIFFVCGFAVATCMLLLHKVFPLGPAGEAA